MLQSLEKDLLERAPLRPEGPDLLAGVAHPPKHARRPSPAAASPAGSRHPLGRDAHRLEFAPERRRVPLDPHFELAAMATASAPRSALRQQPPAPSTMTYSHTASTSGSRWLENSRLIPLLRARSQQFRTSSRPAGSMPLVGSSRITSRGRARWPRRSSGAASSRSSRNRCTISGLA